MSETERIKAKYDSGDIIDMDSMLVYDEDLSCKRCNTVFTLAEGKWKGTHPKYKGVQAHGIKCPNCERVNVSYYKTKGLIKLENRVRKLYENGRSLVQLDKAIRKYKRQFIQVQKTYGEIGSVLEKTA